MKPQELLKKAEEENKRFQKIGKIITTNNEKLELPKLTAYKEMRDACYKEELKCLEKFKFHNDGQLSPSIATRMAQGEDKAFNDGMETICKIQNRTLIKRIKKLKEEIK